VSTGVEQFVNQLFFFPKYISISCKLLEWYILSTRGRDGMGFPRAGLRDFPRAKPEGNSEGQPEENPFHPELLC
jgi:hypothetical protein